MLAPFLDQFLLFTFVLTRVGGLFMTLPVFGSQSIPLQFRGLTAVAIALMVTPSFWGTSVPEPCNVINLAVLLGREAVLGIALGLSVNILFSGMQLAGQIIAQISGLSLADVFDPALDTNVPVFSQLLDATALAVFVTIGGHRQVIDALLGTFRELPPGRADFAPTLVDALTQILSSSFLTGLRAAAPVMVSLMLAVLIIGLISRTLPQLNTINLGFSLNTIVLLGTLAFSISSAVWIFQDETKEAIGARPRCASSQGRGQRAEGRGNSGLFPSAFSPLPSALCPLPFAPPWLSSTVTSSTTPRRIAASKRARKGRSCAARTSLRPGCCSPACSRCCIGEPTSRFTSARYFAAHLPVMPGAGSIATRSFLGLHHWSCPWPVQSSRCWAC